MGLAQHDRVLQVVFNPEDQKPTVKPHDARFIKICAIILILIQDFSTYLMLGQIFVETL